MFFKKEDDKVIISNSQITTFVGVDTKIEGTIISKSSVRVDGCVVGGVCTDGSLIVSKSGQVQGNVIAENVIVAGLVDGNMQIKDKTNIEPSGEVYGDISTDKILIDEESVFQGKINMNKDREADRKRRRIRVDESSNTYEALSEVTTVPADKNLGVETGKENTKNSGAETGKETARNSGAETVKETVKDNKTTEEKIPETKKNNPKEDANTDGN